MKYIFITGGVVSGLGKGLLAASIGRLLQKQGFKIHSIKFDPYFLESPDNLNPNEHGEAFVLDDGTVCDLDLGHYKRFIPNLEADQRSSQTSGKIYKKVIEDSANGKHQGKTTQLVPHVSNEIMERFQAFERENSEDEFTIIEIGGTVGDMESDIYLESIKQFKRSHRKNSILIHLGLLPFIEQSNELKTKALQHSVSELQSRGLMPDILVCRNKYGISEDERKKLAMFCNIDEHCIIDDKDCSVYDLCDLLYQQDIIGVIYDLLDIDKKVKKIDYKINFPVNFPINTVINYKKVAIIGKYFKNIDAYKSIIESLKLQQLVTGIPVESVIINSEILNPDNYETILSGYNAIIIPGGFGVRGINGKILAAHYAREHKVPCLGICLGFQIMCLEFANSNGLEVHHEEFEPGLSRDKYLIKLQDDQENKVLSANTMRLGKYIFNIEPQSKLFDIYGTNKLGRICRYRYEFNNLYKEKLEELGMRFSAKWADENVITSCELVNHPFYIGVQYHPELSSTLDHPEQLFVELIRAIDEKEGD